MAIGECLRNTARGMAGRAMTGKYDYEQIPELGARGRQRLERFFDGFDDMVGDKPFPRRRRLYDRRHHRPSHGRLRQVDQGDPAGRRRQRPTLVRGGVEPAQRCTVGRYAAGAGWPQSSPKKLPDLGGLAALRAASGPSLFGRHGGRPGASACRAGTHRRRRRRAARSCRGRCRRSSGRAARISRNCRSVCPAA